MKTTERSPTVDQRRERTASARCVTTTAWPVSCDQFAAAVDHRFTPHTHDHPHVCFVLGGILIERDGRRPNCLTVGSARLSPAGDTHDLAVGGGSPLHCLVLSIEVPALGETGCFALDGRRYVAGPGVSNVANRILVELQAADNASPISLEMLAIETAALGAVSRSRRVEPTPPWLDRVCERLRDDLQTIPTLEELAHEAGVGRASLARAFRSRYGCTIGQYVRNQRLEIARRLILGSKVPLATVASESGFSDQSHMTRLFSARFGTSPGRFRSMRHTG